MKLQQTPQIPQRIQFNSQNQQQNKNLYNYEENRNSQVSFGFAGAANQVTRFLNFIATNQAWGAAIVDLFSMIVPRTVVDFTRSPQAGTETMVRECSSGVNDALVGVYGFGVAALLAKGLNNKFNVKAHSMFIEDDTLDILGKTWLDSKHENKEQHLHNFLDQIIKDVKAFNPNEKGCDDHGWVKIEAKDREAIVAKLKDGITQIPYDKEGKESDAAKKEFKELKSYVKALMVDATGVESDFKLEKEVFNPKTNKTETKTSTSSVDDFIGNIYKTTKAFMTNEVADTLKGGKLESSDFIKGIKGLNKKTAILGMIVSMIVGVSAQPLNVYMTKKKTGKSGFVGSEDGAGDKSGTFNLLKLGVGCAGIAATLLSITKNPKELMKKIQFKSINPSMDQFKLVYGATIVSRMFSARDKNELRETTIKDSLGFANWLILGGFVSKLAAWGFEKKTGEMFLKHNTAEQGKGPRWFKGSLLTRSEVLHEEFHKAGISTIKNGKAMTFVELIKEAATNPKLAGAKNKLGKLTLIQFAGYLYSGVVLGIGLPKLNIFMTKRAEQKAKKEAFAQAA